MPMEMPKFDLNEGHLVLLDKFLDRMQIRLVHATRLSNLSSILEHGLVPLSDSKFARLRGTRTNDDTRTHHGANCLSIGGPNTRTLATWGAIGEFALLEIDRTILLNKPWFCFPTNSSSKECLEAYSENPLAFCGVDALANLFLDRATTNQGREIVRRDLGTPIGLPNDPQAEVVIDELIEPWWITGVIFPTAASLLGFKDQNLEDKVESALCEPRAFAPRFDAKTWRKGERVSLAPWQRRAV
jgi:hypothetical protein